MCVWCLKSSSSSIISYNWYKYGSRILRFLNVFFFYFFESFSQQSKEQ